MENLFDNSRPPEQSHYHGNNSTHSQNMDFPDQASDSLYIGNLQWYTSDEQIEELIRPITPNFTELHFVEDKLNGISKGYVRVQFTDVESCVQVFKKLQGMKVDDRLVTLVFAQPMVVHKQRSQRGHKRDREDYRGNDDYKRKKY